MIRIGVTGHRRLTDLDKLSAGIEKALKRIEKVYPDQDLTVVSSLAEGADRLVTRHILKRTGSRLLVPLPLPPSDYINDFATAESRNEFLDLLAHSDEVIEMPASASRNAAYEAAGDYIVSNCDVFVAVWDGKPALGTGGTAEIVARARRCRLPIVWIHAGSGKAGSQDSASPGVIQGTVTFENF